MEVLLKLNPQIKSSGLIYQGNTIILSDVMPFTSREDYDPKKLNLGTITIDGNSVEGEFKSNFFANQKLDTIGKPENTVIISLQGGKEARKDDLNAYSILNKIVANHLNNNSKVIEENGSKRIQTQFEAVTNTDLYRAMLSVNRTNFDENGNLIPNGNKGNNVQIPTVGKDSNGKTYFALHLDNEILYFDSTGKKAEFNNGTITANTEEATNIEPLISQDSKTINPPKNNSEFSIPQGYDEKQLNLGSIYVNGENVEIKSNANFYRNEVNNFATKTLNDDGATRLDVQLRAGNTMNPKYNDDSADNILKKLLGNNCDKVAIYQDKSNAEALELFRNTDLYKAFISTEVNGNNFVQGKLKATEAGFNTVQLPSLEVDNNGTKYYVLHTSDKILYFNDRGEAITQNFSE